MRDHSRAIRAFFDSYATRFSEAIADPPKVDARGLRDEQQALKDNGIL